MRAQEQPADLTQLRNQISDQSPVCTVDDPALLDLYDCSILSGCGRDLYDTKLNTIICSNLLRCSVFLLFYDVGIKHQRELVIFSNMSNSSICKVAKSKISVDISILTLNISL